MPVESVLPYDHENRTIPPADPDLEENLIFQPSPGFW
jgi:hypothetical protein